MSEYNKPISLGEHISMKISLLKRDFCVKLTDEDVEHLKNCKNSIQVDNAARSILNRELV